MVHKKIAEKINQNGVFNFSNQALRPAVKLEGFNNEYLQKLGRSNTKIKKEIK